MKTLQSVLLILALSCAVVFMPSCEDEVIAGPCDDVECMYGAACDEGDCVCTQLSQKYLVGNWDFSGLYIATFHDDGTYTTSNSGTTLSYTLDQENNIINFYPQNGGLLLSTYDVQAGFDCNTFDFIDSTTGFELTFVRVP